MKRLRGKHVFKAHRLLCHSTVGLRVTKKNKIVYDIYYYACLTRACCFGGARRPPAQKTVGNVLSCPEITFQLSRRFNFLIDHIPDYSIVDLQATRAEQVQERGEAESPARQLGHPKSHLSKWEQPEALKNAVLDVRVDIAPSKPPEALKHYEGLCKYLYCNIIKPGSVEFWFTIL